MFVRLHKNTRFEFIFSISFNCTYVRIQLSVWLFLLKLWLAVSATGRATGIEDNTIPIHIWRTNANHRSRFIYLFITFFFCSIRFDSPFSFISIRVFFYCWISKCETISSFSLNNFVLELQMFYRDTADDMSFNETKYVFCLSLSHRISGSSRANGEELLRHPFKWNVNGRCARFSEMWTRKKNGNWWKALNDEQLVTSWNWWRNGAAKIALNID